MMKTNAQHIQPVNVDFGIRGVEVDDGSFSTQQKVRPFGYRS